MRLYTKHRRRRINSAVSAAKPSTGLPLDELLDILALDLYPRFLPVPGTSHRQERRHNENQTHLTELLKMKKRDMIASFESPDMIVKTPGETLQTAPISHT